MVEIFLSYAFVKLIFLFNLILLILGIFIIYQGFKSNSQVQYEGEKLEDLERLFSGFSFQVLIFLGIIISAISFFGCFGAFFESPSCLSWYIFLIFLLICVQLTVAYNLNQFQSLSKDEMKTILGGALQKYTKDKRYKAFMDNIQLWLQCCGSLGPNDWILLRMAHPVQTCCIDNKDPCEIEKSFQKGCVNAIDEWWSDIKKNQLWYLGIIIGFQVILIVFTCYARSTIRNDR